MIRGDTEFLLRIRIVKKLCGAVAMYEWIDLNHKIGDGFFNGKWPQESAPKWVRESMILMNLVDESTELEGVGYRHSEDVFYLTIKGSTNADNNGE